MARNVFASAGNVMTSPAAGAFPALFSIDPRYGVADDELTIEIHSLTSLTAD